MDDDTQDVAAGPARTAPLQAAGAPAQGSGPAAPAEDKGASPWSAMRKLFKR